MDRSYGLAGGVIKKEGSDDWIDESEGGVSRPRDGGGGTPVFEELSSLAQTESDEGGSAGQRTTVFREPVLLLRGHRTLPSVSGPGQREVVPMVGRRGQRNIEDGGRTKCGGAGTCPTKEMELSGRRTLEGVSYPAFY